MSMKSKAESGGINYYRRRREAGLCIRCGKPVEAEREGMCCCRDCSEREKARQKALYSPEERARRYRERADAQRARRLERVESGRCPGCGAVLPLYATRKRCTSCRIKDAEYSKRWYYNHKRKAEMKCVE